MATTYTLISSNTLSSSASSVTFSSIPSTYTDLVLKVSARGDGVSALYLMAQFNSTTTGYSNTNLYGDGASAYSSSNTITNAVFAGSLDGASQTASTFINTEIYVPSYTVSQNKPVNAFGALETNSASSAGARWLGTYANLWSNTAAINTILVKPNSGNFVSGSSFYLYGVKNS